MKRVEVRPPQVSWVGIVIYSFFALLSAACIVGVLQDKSASGRDVHNVVLICGLGLIVFGTPTIGGTLWMLRWRIVADEQGMRWRSAFGSWQDARWDEVTDFYTRSSSRNSEKVIEFGEGKRLTIGGQTPSQKEEQLAKMVTEYAINAPFRSWGVKGARHGESFQVKMSAWSPLWWGWGILGFGMVALCFAKMSQPVASQNDWLWKTGPFALLLLPIGILMALAFVERFRERLESLELDEHGLKFVNGRTERFVAWRELGSIQRRRRHHVVRWSGGELTMGVWLPLTIITKWGRVLAPEATLGWNGEMTSRSVVTDGVRFSRPIEAFVLAVLFSALTCIVIVATGLQLLLPTNFLDPKSPPQFGVAIILFLAFSVMGAMYWGAYLRSFVIVGAEGIEIGGLWHRLLLRWSDLEWRRHNKGTALWAKGKRVFLFGGTAELPKAIAEEVGKHLTLCEGDR